MRLAKERKVRSRAWLQCVEAPQLKWTPRIIVLGKQLCDIDDMQSDLVAFLKTGGNPITARPT